MSIDWKAEYLKSVESGCITLDELREARAELDATNRQVEILSDALAESRREVAAIKQARSARQEHEPENEPFVSLASVQERTDYEVHLNHCNIGECEGVCKYLDDDCPALKHADMKAKWDRPTPPAAPVQDLPFGVGGGLVAIKTLLSRDPCVHANTAIEMIDAILKEHPAAQHEPENEPYVSLASVQPVQATMKLESSGPGHGPAPNQKLSVRHVSLIDAGKTPPAAPVQPVQEPEIVQRVKRYAGQTMRTARNPNITARECIELANWIVANTTPPPAQPAVPDAMTSADIQEHIEYVAGWNDCRQAMMEMMK
jgi:hypothetical protein